VFKTNNNYIINNYIMSYNISGVSTTVPPGTISGYIGISDPAGWIICDGVTSTVTDSRYANVYSLLNTAMGVTTNTANRITPPNLKSRVMYGKSTTTTTTMGFGGSSTQELTVANLPPHSHDIFLASNGYITNNGGTQYANGFSTSVAGATKTSSGTTTEFSSTAFSILPPYALINYIMKI
jgi:microcystin-dependent protein